MAAAAAAACLDRAELNTCQLNQHPSTLNSSRLVPTDGLGDPTETCSSSCYLVLVQRRVLAAGHERPASTGLKGLKLQRLIIRLNRLI